MNGLAARAGGITVWLVLGALLASMVSCAGAGPSGVPVTPENRQVRMPHYSFQAPLSRGWLLLERGGPSESVELTRQSEPVLFQVQIFWTPVVDPDLKAATAREAADHVRQTERRIMLEAGVKPGLYELHDLVMSRREIAGRTYYTMDYRTHGPSVDQEASLYLWFPKESGNDAFLMAHFSASAPPSFGLAKPAKADFIGMLETLELH